MADFLNTYVAGMSNSPLFTSNVNMANIAANERSNQLAQDVERYKTDVTARTDAAKIGLGQQQLTEAARQFDSTNKIDWAKLEYEKDKFLKSLKLDKDRFELDTNKWIWQRDVMGPVTIQGLQEATRSAKTANDLAQIKNEALLKLKAENQARFEEAALGLKGDKERDMDHLLELAKYSAEVTSKSLSPTVAASGMSMLNAIMSKAVGLMGITLVDMGLREDPVTTFSALRAKIGHPLDENLLTATINILKTQARSAGVDPNFVESEVRRLNGVAPVILGEKAPKDFAPNNPYAGTRSKSYNPQLPVPNQVPITNLKGIQEWIDLFNNVGK